MKLRLENFLFFLFFSFSRLVWTFWKDKISINIPIDSRHKSLLIQYKILTVDYEILCEWS